jgi:hypothetical protein
MFDQRETSCFFACTQVASEDTVLYTAQAYVNRLEAAGFDPQQARDKLAPLVRCPHLSQHWLSASVLSDDADKLLLGGLQPQLKRLLLLKPARSTDAGLSAASIARCIAQVPASWLLPVREITPFSSVTAEWELDVTSIRQTARGVAARKHTLTLKSGTLTTPLGGIGWGMELQCAWDSSKKGTTVGLYTLATSLPAGSFCRCTFSLSCAAATISYQGTEYIGGVGDAMGWRDFFGLGPMSGGFDEAAWAAKGLPTTGSLKLRLTVKDVGV